MKLSQVCIEKAKLSVFMCQSEHGYWLGNARKHIIGYVEEDDYAFHPSLPLPSPPSGEWRLTEEVLKPVETL